MGVCMRVDHKCDGLAFRTASRLLAVATSDLTGQTWSGTLTLAPLTDTLPAVSASPAVVLHTGMSAHDVDLPARPPPPTWLPR